MKIVQAQSVAPEPAVRHRGGGLQARILLEGASGTPGNFQLSLGETGPDFVSPRHRHNFEQYRMVLEGEYDFGADGLMRAGTVGYFPEGVHYGPQKSGNATLAAVLQFGGVSGGGYLSGADVAAGMEALEAHGEFRDGVFRRREGVPGRRNQDAFEAIWEFVNARRLVYPKSSYERPTMMNPAHYEWTPMQGAPGAAEKRLGRFEANRTGVRLLELAAGAELGIGGRGVFLVLSGTGRLADEPLRSLTAFYLSSDETAEVASEQRSRLLHFELPTFASD
jgi:hypothetical protein